MKTGISIKKLVSLLAVLILLSGITGYVVSADDEISDVNASKAVNAASETNVSKSDTENEAEGTSFKNEYSKAGELVVWGYTKATETVLQAAAPATASVTELTGVETTTAEATDQSAETAEYTDDSQYVEYYEEDTASYEDYTYEEPYTEETYAEDTQSIDDTSYYDYSYAEEPAAEESYVEPVAEEQTAQSLTYLGNFTLTAYCACPLCCGSYSNGYTASGTLATEGVTVAMAGVDFGTQLEINGHIYTVEDRGTAYGHVDIFFNSHEAALQFGLQYADVYMVN